MTGIVPLHDVLKANLPPMEGIGRCLQEPGIVPNQILNPFHVNAGCARRSPATTPPSRRRRGMAERTKRCGHPWGSKCCCHPLSEKVRSVGDLVDYFSRSIAQRLSEACMGCGRVLDNICQGCGYCPDCECGCVGEA